MKVELTKYQKAGIKLLLQHIKLDYPFIIDLIPNLENFTKYGTHFYFDINFNLENFYTVTNSYPPRKYEESPFLYELLVDSGSYLFRYVDPSLSDKFNYTYNQVIESKLYSFYKHLPEYMRLSKFEYWDDNTFMDNTLKSFDVDFLKNWQESKEVVHIGINKWIPVFDLSKYYKKYN